MYYRDIFIQPGCFCFFLCSFIRQEYGRDTQKFAKEARISPQDLSAMMAGDMEPNNNVLRIMNREPVYELMGYRMRQPRLNDFADFLPNPAADRKV